ncbi:MAG: superoxide dismutase [Eisenbergiella sp.]
MIINNTYPFTLPELPYAYDALEPYIDEETMHYHHDKHFKTYVDKLNKALEPYPEYHSWTLEELLASGGAAERVKGCCPRQRGVYNHDMYFDIMAPAGQSVSTAVAEAFGGVENFKKQ